MSVYTHISEHFEPMTDHRHVYTAFQAGANDLVYIQPTYKKKDRFSCSKNPA